MIESPNLSAALRLASAGLAVFPCSPATKRPLTEHGFNDASADLAKVRAWWRQWPDAVPGLPTGRRNGVAVIDLDQRPATPDRPATDGEAAFKALGRDPAEAGLVVRTQSGGLHLYYAAGDVGSTQGQIGPGVDTRGRGGYVIGPGAVTDQGSYTIEVGSLDQVEFGLLPDFPAGLIARREPPKDRPASDPVDLPTIRDALWCIPPNGSDGAWVKVLMALHHATGGSEAGRAYAQVWSADYQGYSPKEVDAKWRSFVKSAKAPVTMDSLLAEARRHGWHEVGADDFDDDPAADPSKAADPAGPLFSPASDFAGLPVPVREWLVPEMVPYRQVTLLYGDGGTGKSLLALQLAAAVATGGDWAGRPLARQGVALFLSAEDEAAELHARLDDICRAEGLDFAELTDLRIVSRVGGDSVLASPDQGKGTLIRSALYKRLDREMKEHRPALLVLDTLADLHSANENDRQQVRQFVGFIRRLALRHDCAVVVLAHPSKAGLSTGSADSGSTGWGNSVRSRLYLDRIRVDGIEPDSDARRLTVKKLNYGRTGHEVTLQWGQGAFWAEAADAGTRIETEAKADAAFLAALAALTAQGRNVNHAAGANFAPSVLARLPEAAGQSKAALRGAMERLLGRGALRVADYEAHRRWFKRLDVPSLTIT